MSVPANEFTQDPDAFLDYVWDWSEWLSDGETISSAVITSPDGLTDDGGTKTDASTSVTVWISGGIDTFDYNVVCSIVTTDTRADDRTIIIKVRER
jgi:hypothetical protein